MTAPLSKSLFRFVLVGGLNTGFAYLLFKLLLALDVHYLAAGAIVWAVGVCMSYVLNRTFTFGAAHKAHAREFGTFVAAYLIQLLTGETTYWLMIGVWDFGPDLAFLANVVVSTGITFGLMRWVVFRKRA